MSNINDLNVLNYDSDWKEQLIRTTVWTLTEASNINDSEHNIFNEDAKKRIIT